MTKHLRLATAVALFVGVAALAAPAAQDAIIRLTADGWLVGPGNNVPLLLGANGKAYQVISEAGAITYTNSATVTLPTGSTITTPTITTPTITGGTQSTTIEGDLKVLAADLAMTSNATLATLTGFSWSVVAAGVYVFDVNLPATMTTNGGLAVAFKYTTATLTSIQVQTYAATAADNTTAVSTQSTTTTDQTKFFDSKTAAYTLVTLRGSFVVNVAGTVAVQVAQNTSHADTTTVLKGAFARLTRAS